MNWGVPRSCMRAMEDYQQLNFTMYTQASTFYARQHSTVNTHASTASIRSACLIHVCEERNLLVAAREKPGLRGVEDAVVHRRRGGDLGALAEDLDRHDERVRQEIVEHLSVKDVHSAVVRGGGEQRVALVEAHCTRRLFVKMQRLEGCRRKIKVPPREAIVWVGEGERDGEQEQERAVQCSAEGGKEGVSARVAWWQVAAVGG